MSIMDDAPGPKPPDHADADANDGAVRETLISLAIALAVAFTAKAYVIEAFMIPTGSMAPTLLGRHIDFHSDQTGYAWSVNPWVYGPGGDQPLASQAGFRTGAKVVPPTVTDPMTTSRAVHPRLFITSPQAARSIGSTVSGPKRLLAGDRILVQKYLPWHTPKRWDVVVFKNPRNRTENFIKRLVGLPMEEVWLVDGDVFTRAGGDAAWRIQRKPDRVQQSLWRTVHSAEYAPVNPVGRIGGASWFISPWRWDGAGWSTTDAGVTYANSTPERSRLTWNHDDWPLHDWAPYNQTPHLYRGVSSNDIETFPVSDLRLRAGVRPGGPGLVSTATIAARAHEFRGVFDGAAGRARLEIRRPEADAAWTELAAAPFAAEPGEVFDAELQHFDQRLELWIDGRRLLRADYDWDGPERLAFATGQPAERLLDADSADAAGLTSPRAWAASAPKAWWTFEGAPVTLHRLGLDRDVYYRPHSVRAGHPREAASLGPDHFFMLGDNSAASSDGRAWTSVDAAIADQIDDTLGVVNRKLLLGKAFFVYFPAWHTAFGRVPVPDFGSMRLIR